MPVSSAARCAGSAAQVQVFEACVGLARDVAGIAIGSLGSGDRGLAHAPVGVAARHVEFGQGAQRGLAGAGFQRTHRVGDRSQVGRDAELVRIAQPDQQGARRSGAGKVVEQGGAAGLAGNVAALDQGAQAAVARAIDRIAGWA